MSFGGSAKALLGALLFVAGAAAHAQDAPPFRVDLDKIVLLAGGEGIGAERTVAPGDELLRTNVGYANAARLDAPLSVTLADLPVSIPAGLMLLEASPKGGTRDRIGAGARVFCAPPVETEGVQPPPGVRGRGRRFDDPVYPCFVDRDGDRRFDIAFLVGTRWPTDRIFVPVAAAFAEEANVALPNSTAWVTFEQGAALQGPVLELHVRLLDQPMNIAAVWLGADRQFFPIERTVRRSAYPHTILFGAAALSVLGYEPEGRRLRIRIDHGFDTAAMDFRYITNTIFIYR